MVASWSIKISWGLRKRIASLFAVFLFFLGSFGQSQESTWLALYDFHFEDADSYLSGIEPSYDQLELKNLSIFLALLADQSLKSFDIYEAKSKDLYKDYRNLDKRESFDSQVFLYRFYLYSSIASSQFGQYAGAATAILKSNRAYQKMREIHPAHPETQIAGALFSIIAEQVPNSYRKFTPFETIDHLPNGGFGQIENVFNKVKNTNSRVAIESGLLWVLLQWEFSSDPQKTWDAWTTIEQDTIIRDLLAAKYIGIMAGLRAGKRVFLDSLFGDISQEEMLRLKYLYYQRGKHRIFGMDESGVSDLQAFISKSEGGNFVKSAWQRMGWFYMVTHNEEKALNCFQKVKSDGVEYLWADQQALKEIDDNERLDPDLLRLRMYYDGGYYHKCLDWIKENSGQTEARSMSFQAEVIYRKARSLYALGKYTEALEAFDNLLREYATVSSYIIPQSAILSAELCMDLGYNSRIKNYLDIADNTNKYGYRKTFERQIDSMRRKLKQ